MNIVPKDYSQKINEAILNDHGYQQLLERKIHLINRHLPKYLIGIDGTFEQIIEANPLMDAIDLLIEFRIEQIKRFYQR